MVFTVPPRVFFDGFGKLVGLLDNGYNIVYPPADEIYFAPHKNRISTKKRS